MKRSTLIIISGASILAAASAAVLPASAAPLGNGNGNGGGRATASQPVQGANQGSTTVTTTLTDAQKAQLAFWVEEEELAQDLYLALAAKYPSLSQFPNIAKSEAQHMTAVRGLLSTYGIADPTVGQAPGVFTNAELSALYSELLNSATTPQAALAAGAAVERKDIADLTAAKATPLPADVLRVVNAQIKASQGHLRAFTR
jgi:hypothetical protein